MSKFTIEDIDKMFPDINGSGDRYYDYGPVNNALGEIIVEIEDHDYQCETRILLRNEEGKFAIYCYSWGSCSGCDFAQGCNSNEEMLEYINAAYNSLLWMNEEELVYHLEDLNNEKDDFGYSCRDENWSEFLKECSKWLRENYGKNFS